MPIYDVQAADGRIYSVEAPEGTSEDQIFAFVQGQMGQFNKPRPQEGIGAALTGGFKRFLSTGETTLESLINPELAAERGAGRSEQIGEQYAPGASLEKVKQAYEQRGLFPAAKEAISQIPAALAEQSPQIAATLGGARVGAMAGSPFGPVGAVVGGVAGAALPSLVQLYGANLERQFEEKAPISRAGALGAAVPGAALEVASQFIPMGRGLVGKLLGPKADEFLKKGSEEAIEAAARESLTASLTKGTVTGALAEIPTEVAQQMLERYQAGLSLTDEQAMKEYGEAAYGAGLVGGPFGAAARGLGRPGARAEFEKQQQAEAERLAVSEEELAQRFPETLPGGFKIEAEELSREMAPAGYSILAEGREEPLSVVDTAEEAQTKLESLTKLREEERNKLLSESDKIDTDIAKAQNRLEQLEATEQAGTDEYKTLKTDLPNMMDEAAQKKADLFDRIEKLGAPLTVTPFGETERVNQQFNVVGPDSKPVGSFKTLGEAEAAVKGVVGEERFTQEKQNRETAKELYKTFVPQMRKFGLGNVGLNIVDRIENGAGGSYLNKLIKVSLEEDKPIQTMRHESLHAMKDLGFFTPQQWKALEERASKEWIKKYLEGQETEVEGQKMSRLEGYRKLGYSEQDIVEEAIADAFGDYDKGAKPPPGLIAALFRKIKNFFSNLGQALRGSGFQSAEDIFQGIERGELKGRKAQPAAEEKLSLGRIPLSTRGIMESNDKFAQSDLGLETEKLKGATGANNVRDIGLALNKKTINEHGQIKDTSLQSAQKLGDAIADEVGWQLGSTAKTGTGLGWYSNNYPNALTILGNRFPELKDSRHARSVFSAIVAVTSNGEDVSTNIKNAIKLYEKLRDGKSVKAVGSRRGTALENNLSQIQALLEKFGTNFENELMREITVADMNAYLRSIGEKSDGSYLKDTKVPAAAIYFGPKLGAFYANLMGAEGYLTMDMWWTRSINRMRGLLKPEATESSINNFRGLIGQPNATINQILEIATGYRNKYDNHGYVTDLEFLAGSKEPSKKVEKEAWFKQAEKKAGDAYDQLLFEHRLEKLSNTIYKNEVEMLEEAPFNASDRKFMYDAARVAQKKLRDEGVNLSIADIQAALWYYEKRLYAKLAGRKADDIGYEEAIIDSAAGARRARPSVVFSDESHRWNVPRTESAISDRLGAKTEEKQKVEGEEREAARPKQPVERPSPRGAKGIERREKLSLRSDLRSYLGSNEAAPRSYKRKSIGDGSGIRVLGAQPVAQYEPVDSFKTLVGQYGFQSPAFYELGGKNAKVYQQAIQKSKDASPYGAAVYVYPEEEYADMRLFLTEDGKAGFALKGDDIVSVFSGPPHKGSANSSLQLAVQEGGRRLDAFDTVLPELYNVNGFQVVGRMKWNEDYKPDGWSKETFSPFNNGEPDVVYMVYDPSDNRTVSENPGEYFDDPDELARVQRDAVKTSKKPTEGIVLGEKQPNAISVKASHYGNAQVDELDASKYGTGLRGAERRRLDDAYDDRIKKRVYFYIQKEDGTTPVPEAGVGQYVYTQQFDNILGPGAEMSRLFREANGNSNGFESNVIDAGYDGYAVPSMGMMVILNHNVPVNYVGPRSEVGVPKLSLKNVRFPTVKAAKEAVKEAGTPDTKEFKLFNAGNQWVDADGKPKVFYHATARDFFEFTPAGQSQAIFLAETPEEAEGFGSIAEDRLRREVYTALGLKEDKLKFLQGVVDKVVEKGTITKKEGDDFMKQANRKTPAYGDFGDIEQDVYDALLELSPTRMSIMPLYARAMTPFDFENKEHVDQVMNWVANNTKYPQDFPEKWLNGMKGRISQGLWQAIEDKRVQQAIRALGFDAFTVRENRASPKNYAVYKPNQVKSATGNDGQFSLESKDIRYSLSKVRYSDDRFEKLWSDSTYNNDTTTNGYMAFVDPADFVKATSTPGEFDRVLSEKEPVDFAKMRGLENVPTMVVSKSGDNWKIIDHQGRHRMWSLHEAGYRDVPVLIKFGSGIEDAKAIPVKVIRGQTGAINDIVMVAEAEPLSYANKAKAMEKFTRMESKVKYSLPSLSAATQTRINQVAPQRYEPTWKERVLGTFKQDFTGLRQKFLNRYEALAVLDRRLREKMKQAGGPALLADQSAEFAALQSDLAAGVTASAMGIGDRQGGVPVYKNGFTTIDTSVKGLTEALAPLAKYGDPEIYQRYQFWAGWKRGRRLLREGREQVYTPADAKLAQEIEAKHPEFVQVQKDLVAFNNGIVNYAVQTGVLSRERAQVYTQYADYIPFYRQLDLDKTIGPNPFSGISGLRGPKELKGGESPLGDFMENLVRNTQSMINAGMKNAAAQKATKVALQLNEVVKLPAPTKGVGYDVYTQLENGELVYYRSADPLFIDALKSLNMPDLPFMGLLSAPANTLRNLVTKDPGFMMANLLRDSLSSYVTSGQNITPIVGTMVNFGKALSSKDKNLQALFNAGVIGGYEFSQNVQQSGKSLSADLNKKAGKDAKLLRPFKSLWEGLEKGTTASDAATRMAVYERVMAETGNEAEAISRALEVMNFNRKGNSVLIRIATAALPFFNARLQGLDLFYRASTGRMDTQDAKEIQRKFWIRGFTMASLSVMYYMSVAGDDEYEKQEEETKDNNWIFPSLGIRVPIPFEVGTLFKTMPERITAYLLGNDTGKELTDSTLRALANTFAFNPIPQTFKPIVEVATNYNFFTMRPIVGQGMQDVAPQFQIGPGTSKTAEYLGGLLNVSPLKLDQLIKGYTGTIGGYVTDVVDSMVSEFSDVPKASKRFEQMPIIKRFALDPEARGNVTQFYELQKSVDTFVRTSNLLEKTARPEEYAKYVQENLDMLAAKDYVSNIEKSMKELRDMKKVINAMDMPPDEKRDLLLDLGRAEDNLTKNTKTIRKALSELK